MAKRPGSPGNPPPSGEPGRKPYPLRKRTAQESRDIIVGKFKALEEHMVEAFPFKRIPPFAIETLDFVKDDGSVTVDFRLMGINPRIPIDDILMAFHEKLDQSGVNGAWLSVGFFNPPEIPIESEEGYKRVQGQLFYRTHARRWRKKLSVYVLEQARWSQEHFFETHRRRPVGVVIRAWWNPFGKRPKFRRLEKKGKKK